MLKKMDKYTIIKLKEGGSSNRKIARDTGINRKTIARYWNEYQRQLKELNNSNIDKSLIQEQIVAVKKYNTENRVRRKYNDDIDKEIDYLLYQETKKNQDLGIHKQKLTNCQIYEIIKGKGYDIGITTITNVVKEKRNKYKEAFIRQNYDFGDRLEYDFGEVKLLINGIYTKCYVAVMSSPGSNFRWAYLYKTQDKEVFMDSHVRFFEMVKGVYKELVYDNMRNVVSKFIGKSEKILNEDLINMSLYYGFKINVTNCFSGNEKGFVEGSVKYIRNKAFATNYKFVSFEEACKYLEETLIKINEVSLIKEEQKCLLPYKPRLELGKRSVNNVNKYSFVRVDNNFYSVPEYLVDKEVVVYNYIDKIKIYINNELICTHKKIDGFNKESVNIYHYLDTFTRKPGALHNSVALKCIPEIKNIYENYFTTNPKKFIEYLKIFKNKNIGELKLELERVVKTDEFKALDIVTTSSNEIEEKINQNTKKGLLRIMNLVTNGGVN